MGRFRLAPLLSLSMVILLASIWADQAMGRSFSDVDLIAEENCDCQRWGSRKRIVGGQETYHNQYPFQVHLKVTFQSGWKRKSINCGGTIIGNHWILTAGHCVKNDKLPGRYASSIEARVGEHNTNEEGETDYEKKYVTDEYFLRNGYSFTRSTIENDIALVRLEDKIAFNEGVGPACLPLNFEGREFDGEKGMAVGWGQEGHHGPASEVLEDIEMEIYSGEKCSRKFKWFSRTVGKDNLCGYNEGGNVCRGDSGGPLVYTENRKNYVLGVASFVHSKKCDLDMYPGVFTRVPSHIDWILDTTGGKVCSL